MDNNFEVAAKKERYALKFILPKNTKYTQNQYTVFDAYSNFNGKNYIIEAKIRNSYYPELLLENSKLQNLISVADKYNTTILYICFTPMGTFCFNISKLLISHPELFTNKLSLFCPKTSMGDNQYKYKESILLPTNLAKKYDYIYDNYNFYKEVYGELLY